MHDTLDCHTVHRERSSAPVHAVCESMVYAESCVDDTDSRIRNLKISALIFTIRLGDFTIWSGDFTTGFGEKN